MKQPIKANNELTGWSDSLQPGPTGNTIVDTIKALGTRRGTWATLIWLLATWQACAPVPASTPPNHAVTATTAPPNSEIVPLAPDDSVWGRAGAPVTLVAFFDFECPFCSKVHDTLERLKTSYGDDLRIIIKHAPLRFHPRAIPAARAAQTVWVASGSDAFFSYTALLFENTQALSDVNLRMWAIEVGVEPARFDTLLEDPAIADKVTRDQKLATRLGVNGVPAFFINGASLVGAESEERFRAIIDHELRATAALKKQGVETAGIYDKRVRVNYRPPPGVPGAADLAFRVPVDGSPTLGPVDAPITLVEFADFECPYCLRAHPTIEALRARYPGKIRWVMKHTPLFFHQQAVPAAVLLIEVRRQKGDAAYWRALSELIAAPNLKQSTLDEIAARFALNRKELAQAQSLGASHPRLVRDLDLAMDLKAQSTPTFFINGHRLSGAKPLEAFAAVIDRELLVSAKLLEQGIAPAQLYEKLQQNAQPPPGLKRVEMAVPAPSDAPSLGKKNAPVTLQMFTDFECPYCGRVMQTLAKLQEKHPDTVRIVWRHLPLSFHRHAKEAAAASVEAFRQQGNTGFWQIVKRLFQSKEPLTSDVLERLAAAQELDLSAFKKALSDRRHDDILERDAAVATQLGIKGTPAFIINGYRLDGAQPLPRFERLVRIALENARAPAQP